MSFRPKDFGKVAEEIYNALQQSGTIPISNTVIEAWIRTAISRAYYSAFLLINERSGKKFHGKRAHEDLVNYLKGKRGIYSIIGTKLDALRRNRIKADYWLPPKYTAILKNLHWTMLTLYDIFAKVKNAFLDFLA